MPFPSQGDVPDPGMKPGSPALQADSLQSEPPEKPKKGRGINKCGCILSVSIEASPVPAVFLRFLRTSDRGSVVSQRLNNYSGELR